MRGDSAMMRPALTLSALVSALIFPWPMTAILVLSVSLLEPLVPLSAGLLTDTLYYAPSSGGLPLFSIFGAIATALAFFVRSRLSKGIIGE
jgi:uncharacterized membrane protein YdjX (TVP38/TMEM64 family)